MYETIYVPVDNSDYSNRAVQASLALGRKFESKLVGCHVYAARMHDYRFKQMEFTLPEEYLQEAELERQRKIHDSLITMGLELISDCYLTDMEKLCATEGLPFEKKMMDGKHATEILRDIRGSEYDLVVLGALGIGRTKDSQIGSVCERVTRCVDRDVWVVKHLPKKDDPERDTILVGIDGSPESFGALMTAIELAERFDKKIELISVYDPYLHYAVFKGIVDVLTERAAKVFRFEEQNQLHEEIIDTGLAEIYQSHLNVAASLAQDRGVEVIRTLLDGKAFQKVLDHVRKTEPWLVVVGRVGVHTNDEETTSLGSNTENLLRLCPTDILLTTATHTPELDLKAEESIHWTPEAEERMTRVPDLVKGIARTGILRLAIEKGHSVVSSDLIDEAMDRFMPKHAQQRTEQLAEALAFDKARSEQVWVCQGCATVARVPEPARCAACSGTDFEILTPDVIDQIELAEGGAEEEATYDGRKLRWTKESRQALRTLTDAYQRRRAKARIEKSARLKHLTTVTLEVAQRFIEDEGGVLYEAAAETPAPTPAVSEVSTETPDIEPDLPEKKLVARDHKNNPLFSHLTWNTPAIERLLRVPSGFMRDRTQERIETLAAQRERSDVDLALVEEGVEIGIQTMAELIGNTDTSAAALTATDAVAVQAKDAASAVEGAGVCPVAMKKAEVVATAASPVEESAPKATSGGKCPFSALSASAGDGVQKEAHGNGNGNGHTHAEGNGNGQVEAGADVALNEVGIMSALERRRKEMPPPADA